LKEFGIGDRVIVDLAKIPGLSKDQGLDYRGITW
jgi:hypothetical protein